MRPVILTVFRPSRRVVVRARICVIMVEKSMCHVVKTIAGGISVDVVGSRCGFLTETKAHCRQQVLVEENDTSTQADPGDDVSCRVQRRLRRLCFLCQDIDGRECRVWFRDSCTLAGQALLLLVVCHCGGCGLIKEEAREAEGRPRPRERR